METKPIYNDGEIYDLQNAHDREDVRFYTNVVKKYGGPVLELACGTGVLTIPIAESGFDIVGLDISDNMLQQAIKKASSLSNIKFVKGNMTSFQFEKKFKTIFVGFNSVCHLFSYTEIKGMLESVKKNLDDQGMFIFDCFIPNAKYLTRDRNEHYLVINEKGLKITETNDYDPIKQINHIKWYYQYNNEEWIEDLDMRMFYPQEIINYIDEMGFEIVEKYGNHEFGEYCRENHFQIYICKKKLI